MTDQNYGPYDSGNPGRYGQPSYGDRPGDDPGHGMGYGGNYGGQPAGPHHGQAGFDSGYPTPNTPVPVGYPQPVNAGIHGKRRGPFASWLGLPLITFGIYNIVWIYKTNKELGRYDQRIAVNPILSVLAVTLGVLLIIPPFVAVWRLCARTHQAQRAAGVPPLRVGVAFTIWLIGPGSLNLQDEINRIWDRYPGAVEGQQIPLFA